MRALLVGAVVVVGACGSEAVAFYPGGPPPDFSQQTTGGVTVVIPDTIYPALNGRCDYPLTVSSTTGQAGDFTDSHIYFTYSDLSTDTNSVNYSQMADVVWPIPPSGTERGVLADDNFSQVGALPYSVRWDMGWTIGAGPYSASLTSHCAAVYASAAPGSVAIEVPHETEGDGGGCVIPVSVYNYGAGVFDWEDGRLIVYSRYDGGDTITLSHAFFVSQWGTIVPGQNNETLTVPKPSSAPSDAPFFAVMRLTWAEVEDEMADIHIYCVPA